MAKGYQEIQSIHGYSIMPTYGFDEDFTPVDSFASTKEQAWKRFCHPCLNRKGYESDGFKPVKVKLTCSIIKKGGK